LETFFPANLLASTKETIPTTTNTTNIKVPQNTKYQLGMWLVLKQMALFMVRWMCGVKLQDKIPIKGLRERLGLDDIISVLKQNRLRWYGHVLRIEDNDWVKKCMERRRTEIVEKDYQVNGLNREDAMDRIRWMKQIRGD